MPEWLNYKRLVNVHYPFVVDDKGFTKHTLALANIPSLKNEPFMDAQNDNSERILFQLLSITNAGPYSKNFSDTWQKVAENLHDWDLFGGQMNRKLTGEEDIIAKAKTFKTDDDKIAYIFNFIKNNLKWNDIYQRYSYNGTVDAWNKKSGNSTEINLILYHLLQKSGLKVYPMLVSTRKHGRINPAYPNDYQFNSTVAYIPVDSTKYYILDASSKYNIYNQIPNDFLNSFGFYMNRSDKVYEVTFLENQEPAKQIISINAEVKPDGKMSGTADIRSFSYKRVSAVKNYKTDGEKKYIEALRDNNNNLKISSIKFEDMEVDTVPLHQNINFDLDLTGTDDKYIYFDSNLFAGLKSNPFLSENRTTDIDFGYRDNYAITGVFKLPAGYKVDVLPQSTNMIIPDKSIVFKRLVAEQDGSVMIRLTVDFKKSMYFKEDYPEFREFCKKMYELLNEQVVLKKS